MCLAWPETYKAGDPRGYSETVYAALRRRWPLLLDRAALNVLLVKLPDALAGPWANAGAFSERAATRGRLEGPALAALQEATNRALQPGGHRATLQQAAALAAGRPDIRALQVPALLEELVGIETLVALSERGGQYRRIDQWTVKPGALRTPTTASEFLKGAFARAGKSIVALLQPHLQQSHARVAAEAALSRAVAAYRRCSNGGAASTPTEALRAELEEVRAKAIQTLAARTSGALQNALAAATIPEAARKLPQEALAAAQRAVQLMGDYFPPEERPGDVVDAPPAGMSRDAYLVAVGDSLIDYSVEAAVRSLGDAGLLPTGAKLDAMLQEALREQVASYVPADKVVDGTIRECLSPASRPDCDVPREPQLVGHLRLERDPSKPKTSRECSLLLDGPIAEMAPREYALASVPDAACIHVFSNEPEKKRPVAEGVVAERFNAQPSSVEDARYRQLARERTERFNQKFHKAKFVQQREVAAMALKSGGVSMMLPTRANPAEVSKFGPRKGVRKRERMEKDDLIDKLFSLFEHASYWALKDLMAETGQQSDHLKTALTEVATLAKHGPNRNKWGLKPEYKTARQRQGP